LRGVSMPSNKSLSRLPVAEVVGGSLPIESTSALELPGPLAERATSGLVVIDGPPPPVSPEIVARDSLGRMTMRATRLSEPLQLDGLLDERVYFDVPAVTDFIQQEPSEGAPATDQTEVWVTFDDETLYVSARCWSEEPDRIVANEMKRDGYGMFGNDTFSVLLDTFYASPKRVCFCDKSGGGLV
ncbi:MAG: hypothetical protein VX453_09575, partial [Acidobacteriota bacterium]|nr:hypothetical protein [Acidobacteriota bacterium]